MATLAKRGKNREIQFRGPKGRGSLYMGRTPERACRVVMGHVEEILSAMRSGVQPASDTVAWVADLPDELHAKLSDHGLVAARSPTRLDAFLADYLAERADVKPATRTVMEQAKKWLIDHLGADRQVRHVTSADADAYHTAMTKAGLARATIAKRIRYARHFFAIALRRKLVQDNPFGHLKGAVTGNPARREFVPAETIDRIIEHVPCPQWRLLIALARYGGLRIPSEAFALKWTDVSMNAGTFTVRASKTAHHEDGGVRVVPIFPELEARFQAVFDAASEGEVYVITRYRDAKQNLRTQFERYIEQAGVTPWPKLWQNLRASRATELADQFPSHVCAKWLGHTERIADTHYRMVTDEHIKRATGRAQEGAQSNTQSPVHDSSSQETTGENDKDGESPEKPEDRKACLAVATRGDNAKKGGNGRWGTRTPPGKRGDSSRLPAAPVKSTVSTANPEKPSLDAMIRDAWADLTPEQQGLVLDVVRALRGKA